MNFRDKQILFVDFETFYSSKDAYTLSKMSVTEFVRDPRFKVHGVGTHLNGRTQWVEGPHIGFAQADWSDVVVVAHNVRFDGAILAWKYGTKPYAWFDTLALAKAILGENVGGYSLQQLAEYLGLPAKGEMKVDGVRDLTPQQADELGAYCKNDVELCKGIYEKLMPQFPESQIEAVDWTIRAFVEPKLHLDRAVLLDGVRIEKRRREEAIASSGIDRKVLSSNKQFAAYLESHGVAVITKTSQRTGQQIPAFARTDEGLTALRTTHPALYKARVASKANLLETRGDALARVGATGSFPFDVNFSGAVQTHRYSGGSGAGGNPQNFTRGSFLRRAVTAPPGSSLVVGDFAAVELRVLSWLAGDPLLVNAIVNGVDLYCDFGSRFYGRTITPADKIERQFGKECILGLGYSMGPKKFAATLKAKTAIDLSAAKAWETVQLYRTIYHNVPKLWDFCGQAIPLIAAGAVNCLFFAPFIKVQKNALVLPSGLRLQYPNLRQDEEGEWVYDKYTTKYKRAPMKLYGGKVVENLCQALAGELTKSAISRCEAAGLRVVGQVHDELIAISPDEDIARSVEVMRNAMEKSPVWLPALRLKAEVHHGKNWLEAK